jgi:hypothetical protein
VPERVLFPPPESPDAAFEICAAYDATQTLPETFISVKSPETVVAFITDDTKGNPAVDESDVPPPPEVVITPTYPVVSTPPESPNCICMKDEPFVLTPLNITVIRLAVLGMPVKSTLVPDADTAVPDVIVPAQDPSPRRNVVAPGVPVASIKPDCTLVNGMAYSGLFVFMG